jgi:NifU-like protein involved in Fe-S cluster formation
MTIYNEFVQDHYRNPRNLGRLEGATASTRLFRGDAMLEFHLRVVSDRVEAASFRAIGCAGTVAAASAMTEWLVGRTLEEARCVTAQTVLEILLGLPDERLYCADFIVEGLGQVLGNSI